MLEALAQHLPDVVRWTRPTGGFFSWVTLPEGVDTVSLASVAMERRVAFVPGAPFYPDGGGRNALRLAFSRVDDDDIEEGIQRLASVIVPALREA